MLILSRNPGEEIVIGDDIVMVILGIKGSQVRVGIRAPKNVRIDRGEVRKQPEAQKDPTA